MTTKLKKITEADLKRTWNTVWAEHNSKSESIFLEKIFRRFFCLQFSSRSVYREIEKYIHQLSGKELKIIECGCGSGLIQKNIYEHYGHKTHFLDISAEALRYSRKNLGPLYSQEEHKFIQGSLFNMPVKNDTYDIVWNAGVLEHFNEEDQRRVIEELFRVTKKGGYLIILVPSTFGRVYLKMKKRAEQLGTWRAGYEEPLTTFKPLVPPFMQFREYSFGFVTQLHFLKYLFKPRLLILGASFVLEFLQRMFYFLENRPGYFLACVVKKS